MSTYNPIGSYLAAQPGPPGTTCTITFKQFQQLTGVPLPRSAFQHSAWWGNNPQRHVQVVPGGPGCAAR